jgi:hypothetical protein
MRTPPGSSQAELRRRATEVWQARGNASPGHDLHAVYGDGGVLLQGRRHRAGELVAEPLARHGADVEVGLADRRLQVRAPRRTWTTLPALADDDQRDSETPEGPQVAPEALVVPSESGAGNRVRTGDPQLGKPIHW